MADASSGSKRRLLLAYADSSADLVAPLRNAFEAAGFTTQIAPADQTEAAAAIDATSAVIVCWTPAAVASDIVNLQAARAQKARRLAAILLAPCSPPANLGGRFRLADLSGWRGDPTDKEFIALVHALHDKLSGRIFSSGFWRSPYFSWGGAGALTLGAVAMIANFGDLRQTIDGFVNPGASEASLNATDAKVEEVLALLKQQTTQPLTADVEAALRESIERLLSAQSGARRIAATKLANGDLDGALTDLRIAAQEGESAAKGLSETWQEIGALTYATDTLRSLNAYARAVQLSPDDHVARGQLGNLYLLVGQLDEAEEAFERVLYETDDKAVVAAMYANLGVIRMMRGELREARILIEEALDRNEKAGDAMGQASDLGDLGEISRSEGKYPEAIAFFNRSLALYKQVEHREGEALATARLGAVARDERRYDEAERLFTSALAMAKGIDDRLGQSFALSGLGDVALDRGDLDLARQHYIESHGLAVDLAAGESETTALIGLGIVAERQGDAEAAIEYFRNAYFLFRDMKREADMADMEARLKKLGTGPIP